MDKEENQNNTSIEQNQDTVKETEKLDENLVTENKQKADQEPKEEIEELTPEEKIAELEDKVARTFAEMENQRRRFEKEKEDAFEYGGFSFAREALNLIDNLERSKISLESDNDLKDTEALKKILEHLNIINKDMLSILKKNNIEPIKSINEKLNPNIHQAMMEIEDNNKEAGTIVQEIQKGFMMKDRLLRPSLVGVSKKSEKIEEINDLYILGPPAISFISKPKISERKMFPIFEIKRRIFEAFSTLLLLSKMLAKTTSDLFLFRYKILIISIPWLISASIVITYSVSMLLNPVSKALPIPKFLLWLIKSKFLYRSLSFNISYLFK